MKFDPVTEATRLRVLDLYDAIAKRDSEAIAGHFADDIEYFTYVPIEFFTFGGRRVGKVAAIESMRARARDYSLEGFRVTFMVAESERASVRSDVTLKQRLSGRTLRSQFADFLRFKDGKLIEFRQFADSFDMIEQALGREIHIPLKGGRFA